MDKFFNTVYAFQRFRCIKTLICQITNLLFCYYLPEYFGTNSTLHRIVIKKILYQGSFNNVGQYFSICRVTKTSLGDIKTSVSYNQSREMCYDLSLGKFNRIIHLMFVYCFPFSFLKDYLIANEIFTKICDSLRSFSHF